MKRDAQRQRLYDSERFMHGNMKPMSAQAIQELVDKIKTDPVVNERFPRGQWREVTVEMTNGQAARAVVGTRGGAYGYRFVREVRFGKWSRKPEVVLHEVAHHIAGLNAAHGPHFAFVLRFLVHRFMGADVSEQLRQSYVKHGVEARPKSGNAEMPRPLRKLQPIETTDEQAHRPSGWKPLPQYKTAAKQAPKKPKPPLFDADGRIIPCSFCGKIDGVGRGGSVGKPCCNSCYRKARAGKI